MLKTLPTPPGLLFGSFLYRADIYSQKQLLDLWIDKFGESHSIIPEMNPLITYYAKEMGNHLSRFIVISDKTFPRSELLSTKLTGLSWENQFAVDGKRMVNVDIGFLSAENFVLATTKNYSHRIFIGQDIFADLTFEFKQGEFRALPWTYPDYQDPSKIDFLMTARKRLLASFLPMM
jgi:hypothetical protein